MDFKQILQEWNWKDDSEYYSKHDAYIDEHGPYILAGMTFTEALYCGKRYIRCPFNQQGTRTGYDEFDIQEDTIFALTTLHDVEFNTSNWEACDDPSFGEE